MSITRTDRDDVMPWTLFGQDPAAIETQEALGQAQLMQSELLPTEGSNHPAWAKLGFVFGEPVEGDPIFRHVTLPPGWTKVSTAHAMHSNLVDDKGRRRGGIFYKAAFYDRSAHMYPPECRYSYTNDYLETQVVFAVYDYGVPGQERVKLFETAPISRPEAQTREADNAYWAAKDKAEKEVKAWLHQNFPDYQDPLAYWDEK